ncbi:Suppressor of stem-loop protein 1 [Smittium culicis]|uniref:General transcription and DNA repair factor IIH n=1 Tax=Smittium culicis TaxID=133412 RepID=A0A1R1XML8_9FUNG|nr:Suppressor of stem-loop protein 1 [Smittium culicis]OMJ17554.1 Suppressor of stem-loop protein 1 [Smittium culicis]
MSKNAASEEPLIDVDDSNLHDQESGYTWEEFKRSWDVLQEDDSGSLQKAVASFHKKLKLKRKQNDNSLIQKGLVRYCYIILDCSSNTSERDLRPSRLELALQTLEAFVSEFFEQNPLGQIGLIVSRDGLAEKITDLSSNFISLSTSISPLFLLIFISSPKLGNPSDHIRSFKSKKIRDSSGSLSLQNSLMLAINSLKRVPKHGSREIFTILGSLTSTDPSDINSTISDLIKENIRVSIVEMSAEVFIFKKICTDTNGTFSVAINEAHFRELVLEFISPPPIFNANSDAHLITMGFATSIHDSTPTFCSCHFKLSLDGYLCPRCNSKVCSLPSNCDVCGLSLVSSPHLSRSYHHLFPTNAFKELVPPKESLSYCYSCMEPLSDSVKVLNNQKPDASIPEELFQCPKCLNVFCLDCDLYIHETVHNCPGCV